MFSNSPFFHPLLHFAADAKNFILDTLFPAHCLSCGRENIFLCPDCSGKLTGVSAQKCPVCQKPAPGGRTHPGCQSPQAPDGLISLLDYHDRLVAKVIITGKYYFLPNLYKQLGTLLAEGIIGGHRHILSEPATLAPIPLHPSRKRWRGFNQAEILCETLSKRLNLPTADVLVRAKSTKTQKDLKKEQRLKNVEGCFALKKEIDVKGQSFLLVDDVATTGSTLREAAKVLKRNGARAVWCLTVARD